MPHYSLALLHKSDRRSNLKNIVNNMIYRYGVFDDIKNIVIEKTYYQLVEEYENFLLMNSGNNERIYYKDFLKKFYKDASFDCYGNLRRIKESCKEFEIEKYVCLEYSDLMDAFKSSIGIKDEYLAQEFLDNVWGKRDFTIDKLKGISYEEYIQTLYPNELFDTNGNYIQLYNSKCIYNWYDIGGNWNNILIKKGTGKRGNSFKLKDIDFDAMEAENSKFHTHSIVTPDKKYYDMYSFEDEYSELSYKDHIMMWIDRYDCILLDQKYQNMTLTIIDFHGKNLSFDPDFPNMMFCKNPVIDNNDPF